MGAFRVLGAARFSVTTLAILSSGCGKPDAQAAAGATSPPAVMVETAERREVPIMLEVAARVEAVATVEIRANVSGRLTEMSFREGSLIKKGQMLFRIDPRRYEAAVQSAQAAVEKAQADLEMAREQQHLVNAQSALRQAEADLLKANQDAERLKPLAASRAVPQRDLEAAIAAQSSAVAAVEAARATVRTTTVSDRMGVRQAQAGLAASQAALDQAELDREQTAVRAPINGLIGRLEVSVGNYVDRGDQRLLATISQADPINVGFNIPETLYIHTTTGRVDHDALNHIELILADNSIYPFQGRYTTLGRAMDEKTGTLAMVAQFPNPRDVLLPGMSGHVRFAVEKRPDAVLVSERAVFDAKGSKAVYVVTPQNKALLRSVVAAGKYQGRSIITKGLAGGETVIADGIQNVRPGQTVTAQRAAR
ncbi:MAG TPA: efflux RND transporter periplasmic adaptor subunit [Bryobacteraceae bacterium]|nr:efflux RND transporter periplasmic adaptor subunit [Bryobacteraceae bacterium]